MSSARWAGLKFARGSLTVQRVTPSRTTGAPGGWADRGKQGEREQGEGAHERVRRGGEGVSVGNPGMIPKRGDLLRRVGF
jgi:hypothetical protein